MKITAVVPCAIDSWQFPNRNIRSFGGDSQGLVGVKLRQLLKCDQIDQIVVSTNDEKSIEIATSVMRGDDRVVLDLRDDALCQPETSTSDLCGHFSTLVSEGHMLWTHVTSPLVNESYYHDIIECYKKVIQSETHDSLMTVTRIQSYLWNEIGPYNYDVAADKWPRTRLLKPLFNVNSAAFIVPVNVLKASADRIGENPFLYELDEVTAIKIDTEEQFKIADYIHALREMMLRAAYT